MPLTSRRAVPADAELLGELNFQLIEDEGYANTMTVPELQHRMRGWLTSADYAAVIFKIDNEVIVYALYWEEKNHIYLRQLFVQRYCRRHGFGREAVQILRTLYWPAGKRLSVDVLFDNTAAIAFYKAIGFRDYCVTLEIPAPGK